MSLRRSFISNCARDRRQSIQANISPGFNGAWLREPSIPARHVNGVGKGGGSIRRLFYGTREHAREH
jgi:hypothetical protein